MNSDFSQTKIYNTLMDPLTFLKNYITNHKIKSFLLGFTSISLIRYITIKIYRKYKKYPPGPIGLPFIGPLLFFLYKPGEVYMRLSKQYGDIAYVNFSSELNIAVLSHSSVVDQVLLDHKVLDRPPMFSTSFQVISTTNNIANFGMINGDAWSHRRNLAKQAFVGISTDNLNKILESSILSALFPYLNDFVSTQKEWKSREIFSYMAFNTIYHMNFGEAAPYKDPFSEKVIQYHHTTMKWVDKSKFLYQIPILQHIPFIMKPFKDFRKERTDFYISLIEKRKNSSAYNKSNPQSYVDYMLAWNEDKQITTEEMISDLFVMFTAGTETTASTMEYSILLLCKYPMIQKQIYDELFGLLQQTNLNNNNNNKNNNDGYIHYNNELLNLALIYRAFLHEVYRISSIAAHGFEHYNKDKNLTIKIKKVDSFDNKDHEYVIPPDTIILYHSEYIHKFNNNENWVANGPELCLDNWFDVDENGKKTFSTKDRPLYAFGVGKRECVGRLLAEKEIHFILGYLILNFEFSFYDSKYFKNPSNVKIELKRSTITSIIDPEIGVLVNKRKINH